MKHVIVGCGSIGERHIRNLKTLGEKDLLGVDVRPDRRRFIESEFGIPTESAFDEDLAQRADAVYVTTPSSMHMSAALIAARAACHLFIEKPLATGLDGIDELLALVKSQNLVGFVGSNWKFHPSFKKMKECLEAGSIGKILTARCLSGSYLPEWHPWEDYRVMFRAKKDMGGGIIFDNHEFDYMSWMLGPVSELSCLACWTGSLDIETEDVALVTAQYQNGIVAQFQLDFVQRSYQRRYEFCGQDGSIIWDVRTSAVEVYSAKKDLWQRYELPRGYNTSAMYVEEMRHFLNCVNKKEEPITPLEHGKAVLEMMLAAKRSHDEKKVVSLKTQILC